MLIMTLKGIKKMLDKALPTNGRPTATEAQASFTLQRVSVENARDMLEELIKELEKKPDKPPEELPPNTAMCTCTEPKETESGNNCGICGKPIDYKSQVL